MRTTRLHEVDGKNFLIDPITGEAQEIRKQDGQLVFIPVRKKMRANFSIIEHSAIEDLIDILHTGMELRTFLVLCMYADFENRVYAKAHRVATTLMVRAPQLSRCLSDLERQDLIIRGSFDESDPLCVINPYFIWRGDNDRRAAIIRKWNDQSRQAVIKSVSPSRANGENNLFAFPTD